MNAVIYVRVSSIEQVDGTSLTSQQAACREYAQQKGWTILETFVEEGESAKFVNRTKLLQLLNYCKDKTNNVNVVLFWKLDRMTRDNGDYYAMIKPHLHRYGVKVASVTEPIDESPTGRFMESILVSVAQLDNDIRAARSVLGMQQRLKEGIFPWRPPHGYLAPKIGKKIEPDRSDPACFDQLRQAWQLLDTGGHTKASVLRLLREWGVRAPGGGVLSAQTLDTLFRNPYYAGRLIDPWTKEEYKGRHVAMVSEEQFARVQMVLDGRNRSVPHRAVRDDFPLRGLVRCPSCAWPMTAAWTKGRYKKYAYYECHQRHCPERRRSLSAQEVHDEFLDYLPGLGITPVAVPMLTEVILELAAEQSASIRVAADRRRQHVVALERKRAELVNLRLNQMVSDDEFAVVRDRIRDELNLARAEPSGLAEWPLTPREARDLAMSLGNLTERWHSCDAPQKQAFGRFVFPAGYAFQRIRTAEKSLLLKTIEGFDASNPNLVPLTIEKSNTIFAEIRKFLGIVAGHIEPEKKAA